MPLPDALRDLVANLSRNAHVVWLAGSYARGDHARFSDVDLGVLQEAAGSSRFEAHSGLLVSIVTTTVAATRASFRNPAAVGGAIPGWRTAELLHDPEGIGVALRDEATDWSWDLIAPEADLWVADQVTRLADPAMKLLNAIERDDPATAALARSAIASGLSGILAVHLRLLYDSESKLVSEVTERMGHEWRQLHDQALGTLPGREGSLLASFELWRRTSDLVRPLLSESQREVVDLVSGSAGRTRLP
jgi:hypothetical protein